MKILVTTLLLVASSLAQNTTTTPAAGRLVGTWRLVSVEDTMKDGTVKPAPGLGPHAKGYLMYEPDGYMCAALMDPDRPAWKEPYQATDAEKIASFDTFIAYCGTYTLDSEHSTVTHRPEVAWLPAYVGSTQPRPFTLEGDRLIITVTISDPKTQKRTLVWERAR